MFALVPEDADPQTVNLKCDPELAIELRAQFAAIEPGYHMNKRHWNTVALDGTVPQPLLGELIAQSYDLVVSKLPKRVRGELGG